MQHTACRATGLSFLGKPKHCTATSLSTPSSYGEFICRTKINNSNNGEPALQAVVRAASVDAAAAHSIGLAVAVTTTYAIQDTVIEAESPGSVGQAAQQLLCSLSLAGILTDGVSRQLHGSCLCALESLSLQCIASLTSSLMGSSTV